MLIITSQIKAARHLIGWEQWDLANNSGVAVQTVRRLERQEGRIAARFETVEKISKAFERAGVTFMGEPNPGVYLIAGAGPSRDSENVGRVKYSSGPAVLQRKPRARRRSHHENDLKVGLDRKSH